MDDNNGDWGKVMQDIVNRVLEYTEGRQLWIAQQQDDEFNDVFGFAIVDIPGKEQGGFAWIRLVDARKADNGTIRSLATKVLGFAPNSPEDLTRRKAAAEYAIQCIESRIEMEQRNLNYYRAKLKAIDSGERRE